jgi:hypothetical protein
MTSRILHRSLRGVLQGTLLALALHTTQPAWALSDAERAGARAAATEGEAAFNAGRWAESLDLFQRAEAIIHSPVHLLFIAQAQIELGKLVEAREALIKIMNEPVEATASPALRHAQQEAEPILAALEPRIPHLTVKVEGGEGQSVVVEMDGVAVPPTLIGLPRPVNPGEHQVTATAPGLASAPTAVTLGEGERESIVLKLEPALAGAEGGAVAGEAETSGTEPAGPGQGMNPLMVGGIVGLGVGVVGLGVGTFFMVKASGTQSDSDAFFDRCANPTCEPDDPLAAEVIRLDDRAASQRGIGIAGLVIGGVGVAAGTSLLILSAMRKDSGQAPQFLPYVGVGSAGVVGRF